MSIPKTLSGEIDISKVEIDHDRGDCAHTIKKSLVGNTALDEESSDTKDNQNVKIQYKEGKSVPQSHMYGSKQVEVAIPGCHINNESSMNIFLQIHRGETIALVVNCFDTIDYLKMMVHHKKGIPPDMQRIFFGLKELEVNKTLLDSDVDNGAKLYLLDRQISVMRKRTTYHYQAEISDTVESVDCLKKEIQKLEHIPPAQQRIMYAGKQLEDGHSLSDYGIQREATIDISVTLTEVAKMKIMPKTSSREIDTPKVGSFHKSVNLKGEINHDTGDCSQTIKKSIAGNSIALDKESSDTKDSLKVKIQNKKGESVMNPPKNIKRRENVLQRDIYGSKQAEVEIPGCNINNESNPFSMNVFVVSLCWYTPTALVVNCFDTVGSLKMKVQDAKGIPPGQQRIIFGGKQLINDKPLLDYGVHNGAKLDYVLRLRGGGGKFSVMRKQTTYHYQVEISGTVQSVDSLKEKIQEREEICPNPSEQRIMYAGQQLEDGHSLSDYGIQREATVDVCVTRGGDCKRIELSKIRSATRNFDNAYLVDEGGSAKVYKGELCGKTVAIKKLKPERDETEPNETKYFGTEIAALEACEHLNIVKIIGYYMDEKERIIVSEYVPRGSLYSLLHARSPDDAILDWNARLQIALDIASALDYLHTEIYFIHRDLKTKNILLDEDLRAKVADFGIVKSQADDDGEVYTKLIGTQGYLCPDYLATGLVGTYSDVYAFGVILLELITGRKALDTTTHTLLADWARRLIKDGRHCDLLDPRLVGKIEESVLKDVANLATKCVAWKKNDRPSMTDIHSELLSMKLGWKN